MSHWLRRIKHHLDPFKEVPTQSELVLQFKEVYSENCEFIRNVIFGMVRNQAVDDLVQETFYKAWRSYSKFQRDASERTWLYRIARNTVYDYLRSQKSTVEFDDVEDSSAVKSDDVILKSLIDQAVGELSPKHREVFVLHYQLGHTTAEISKLVRVSEGTVKSRLYYARDKFANFLKANGVNNER